MLQKNKKIKSVVNNCYYLFQMPLLVFHCENRTVLKVWLFCFKEGLFQTALAHFSKLLSEEKKKKKPVLKPVFMSLPLHLNLTYPPLFILSFSLLWRTDQTWCWTAANEGGLECNYLLHCWESERELINI